MRRPFPKALAIAVLALWSAGCAVPASRTPTRAGLRPCPSSPNCVSSEAVEGRHHMDPIPFSGRADEAQKRLRAVLLQIPRSRITSERPGYIAASFRSRVFRFVDEAEFAIDERGKMIQFRSGAKLGYADFGVNRSRMARIAEAFAASR